MKTLAITTVLFVFGFTLSSQAAPPAVSQKVIQLVEAIPVGNFSTERAYLEMLGTSCKNSRCNSIDSKKIIEVGRNIASCNKRYLSGNKIKNSDIENICNHKQPIFGCDSNATPLLRKMCYGSNGYSFKVWAQKEKRFKRNRMPASK